MTIAKAVRGAFAALEWIVNSEIVFYAISIIFLLFAIWLALGALWRFLRRVFIFPRRSNDE